MYKLDSSGIEPAFNTLLAVCYYKRAGLNPSNYQNNNLHTAQLTNVAIMSIKIGSVKATLLRHGYKVLRPIGTGSSCTVFLAVVAEGPRAEEGVAIKVIENSKLNSREWHLLRLGTGVHQKVSRHPNIVDLYDAIKDSKYKIFVMEMLEGPDVCTLLQKKGVGLKAKSALQIAFQVVQALKFIHSKGCAHRDIKLENVVFRDRIGSDGTLRSDAVLVDFGLAFDERHAKINSSKSSDRCGTVGFVAPDINTRIEYDPQRADVWSVGVLLYSMIALKLPFKSKEPFALLFEARNCDAIFKEQVWSAISKDSKDLIRSCLNTKPECRPSSLMLLEKIKNIFSRDKDNRVQSSLSKIDNEKILRSDKICCWGNALFSLLF